MHALKSYSSRYAPSILSACRHKQWSSVERAQTPQAALWAKLSSQLTQIPAPVIGAKARNAIPAMDDGTPPSPDQSPRGWLLRPGRYARRGIHRTLCLAWDARG
jgi:hypothetical protein